MVFLIMTIVNPGSEKIHTYLVTKDMYKCTYISFQTGIRNLQYCHYLYTCINKLWGAKIPLLIDCINPNKA